MRASKKKHVVQHYSSVLRIIDLKFYQECNTPYLSLPMASATILVKQHKRSLPLNHESFMVVDERKPWLTTVKFRPGYSVWHSILVPHDDRAKTIKCPASLLCRLDSVGLFLSDSIDNDCSFAATDGR